MQANPNANGDCFPSITPTTRISKDCRLRILSRDLAQLNRTTDAPALQSSRFYAIQHVGATSLLYRSSEEKKFWRPNVPELSHPAGNQLRIRVYSVTPKFLMENLGQIIFRNELKVKHAPKLVELSLTEFDEDSVTFRLNQGGYKVGRLMDVKAVPIDLENCNGIPRLVTSIKDFFGIRKNFALYHNGANQPSLGIGDGRQFRAAKFAFADGIRLVVAYHKFRDFNLWTGYLKSPSELYSIESEGGQTSEQLNLPTALSFKVRILRPLERKMLFGGTAYEHGRLGAEIAHSIGTKFLDLNPIIGEPSSGGKDLWTEDHGFTFQARFIADFRQFHPLTMSEAISRQVKLLFRKIGQDFANSRRTHTGFVIFSYLDNERSVHSLVFKRTRKVAKPRVYRIEERARWDLNPRHAG